MSRVVRLHIGAPKTGTTYIQDRLSRNVASLAEHGVHFPSRARTADPALFHFRAALDLLGQDWGGPSGHAQGAWGQLTRKVRRLQGNVVISHEILAPATPDKIARAMNDLSGSEVHIVYSARDLVRGLPAAWQESIKQGRQWRYQRFLDRVQRGQTFFGKAFDLPTVLNAWSRNLPPERIHVVAVPPSGAPHNELWHRFCRALEIDPSWAPLDSESSNESLGVAEAEMLRRLNRRIGRTTRSESAYDDVIRQMIRSGRLRQRNSRKVELPHELYPWAAEQSERWIDWIEGSGVNVVGNLDDLRPGPVPDRPYRGPDDVSRRAMARASFGALEVMTEIAASRKDDGDLTTKLRVQAERLRKR